MFSYKKALFLQISPDEKRFPYLFFSFFAKCDSPVFVVFIPFFLA